MRTRLLVRARAAGPRASARPCPAPAAPASRACGRRRRGGRASSTPSRWSISCRNTRPRSSSPSTTTSLPSRSDALHGDDLRPHDLEREAGQRQAALFVDPLAGGFDDLGVEQHVRAVADVVDEEPLLHADLRGREADAGRFVHRLVHRVDELRRATPSMSVDGRGRALQHRIAEDPDRVRRHRGAWYRRADLVGSDPRGVDGGAEAAVGAGRRRAASAQARARGRRVRRPGRARDRRWGRARGRRASRNTAAAARSASSSPVSSASAPNGG